MNDQSKPLSSLQKFRKENRRVDFYPTRDSLAALERLRQRRPHESTRLLLDRLVIAGAKSIFPESGGDFSGKI